MIIKALLDLIYTIFNVLTLPLDIPDLPPELNDMVSTMVEYIGLGLGILANYTHLDYLLTLFGIVVAIDIGLLLYKLVMFVIKKIPMLNIR